MTVKTNLVRGLYTLDYCVKSVLADIEQPESKGYLKYLKWSIDAFRRLNLAGQLPTIKTATLAIDEATCTVTLPDDFLSLIKLGICCHGHLINFDVDDSLCLKSPNQIDTCPCSDDEINEQIQKCCSGEFGGSREGLGYNSTWYYPFYSHWHNGQFTAGFYGQGAGFRRGGYKLNVEANIIQFSSGIHNIDEVVLEYTSTGIDESGNAIVPQGAIGAICAYIHEKRCANSKDQTDKQMVSYWNRKWTSEATAMVKRKEALSHQEWQNLFRSYNYQSPKR